MVLPPGERPIMSKAELAVITEHAAVDGYLLGREIPVWGEENKEIYPE